MGWLRFCTRTEREALNLGRVHLFLGIAGFIGSTAGRAGLSEIGGDGTESEAWLLVLPCNLEVTVPSLAIVGLIPAEGAQQSHTAHK